MFRNSDTMDSSSDIPTNFETRRPSHSSPNSSALSDSAFAQSCSISPVDPLPAHGKETFLASRLPPPPTPPDPPKSKWLPKFTPRQWLIFFIFILTNFLAGLVYNLKGPFYPEEAERKHVGPSQYGFVFGIFEFTKIFASPIYGKYMNQLGARRIFIGSLYVVGICSILFGLLDEIADPTAFLVCSLALRVTEAIGSSGYTCSSFSIIAHEFPGAVATTFSVLEASFGLGLIVSPPLGGILYQVAGYPLPFITVGLLIFTSVNFVCVIMPRSFTVRDSTGRATEGVGIFQLFKVKGILFSALGVLTGACSTGFINATLEPHLRQFNLSPFLTGIVFAIYGFVYTLTAPAYGAICDKIKDPKYISLIGATSNFIAFLLIGPAPMFNFGTRLWVTCLGLVLHGLALGAIFVSMFILAFSYAVASGMPSDMKTHSAVSGMWTSVLSLGMFLGPSVGGILLDRVGFRWGSLFALISMACLIILIVTNLLIEQSALPPSNPPDDVVGPINSKETDPLIFPSQLSVNESSGSRPQQSTSNQEIQSRPGPGSNSYGAAV